MLFADALDERVLDAIQTADTARALLAEPPWIAMLSFSTHGARRPELVLDGELQADAALDPAAAIHKCAEGDVVGHANVLVFPDLDAANIGYKLVRSLAGAAAYGVFLQRYTRPVAKLSRGSTTAELAGTARILRELVERIRPIGAR